VVCGVVGAEEADAGGVEKSRGDDVGVDGEAALGKSSNGRLGTSCEAGGTG
jgi:hypothetical protein